MWLYPTTPGDYEGDVYLWVDPLLVMPDLGLNPENPEDVLLATELVAEASLILDVALDYRFGPSRCVAATYRVRAFPVLNFAPPIQTIHAVVLHDDSCLPSDDVYVPTTGGLPWWQSWVNALLSQGTVLEPGSTYCVDTPSTVRLCGGLAGQPYPSSWYGYGYGVGTGVYVGSGAGCIGCRPSNLVTVLYKSRANWPPGLARIFMTLLKDLQAGGSSGECALPAGATSVTRQGVSWSVEESDTDTGIPTVDKWIARHQQKIRLRDPMHATLLYSRYYDGAAFAAYSAPCALPTPVTVAAGAPSARKPWSAPALMRR